MPASAEARAWSVAGTGLVGLAVAVGLGRFAFTPLLPMMLQDGLLDLRQASWLASSNYLGYLLGALACALQPWLWRQLPPALGQAPRLSFARLIRLGLLATVVLTLAMALPWPWAWPGLRLAAGLASALVFVYGSGWSLSQLTRLGKPQWGGLIYMGPGLGIVISGLAGGAMVGREWSSPAAWLCMGVLAVLGTALVWPVLGEPDSHEERLVPAIPGACWRCWARP